MADESRHLSFSIQPDANLLLPARFHRLALTTRQFVAFNEEVCHVRA